jgi:hypothetical protein
MYSGFFCDPERQQFSPLATESHDKGPGKDTKQAMMPLPTDDYPSAEIGQSQRNREVRSDLLGFAEVLGGVGILETVNCARPRKKSAGTAGGRNWQKQLRRLSCWARAPAEHRNIVRAQAAAWRAVSIRSA